MVLSKAGSATHGSQYWRDRAAEARAMANKMAEGIPRATMLDIATKYDLMAKAAAEKEARLSKSN